MRRSLTSRQSGFTIVEIAVVAPFMILLIMAIVGFLVTIMLLNISARAETEAAYNTKAALTTIQRDISLSSGFNTEHDGTFTDLYGETTSPTGGATSPIEHVGLSEAHRALILTTYAHAIDANNTPDLVFVNQNGCSGSSLFTNPALTVNIIYFVRDGDLYRRTLTDDTQTTCTQQANRHSCPPGRTNDSASNALCDTNDSLLATDISSFNVQYYASAEAGNEVSGAYACVPSSGCASILDAAKSVKITIETEKSVAGNEINYSDSIRASLLN